MSRSASSGWQRRKKKPSRPAVSSAPVGLKAHQRAAGIMTRFVGASPWSTANQTRAGRPAAGWKSVLPSFGALAGLRQAAARLQKHLQFPGRFSAKARHSGNVLNRRQPKPVHRAEFFEQGRLPLLADAGKFVENAFGNLLQTQLRV